MYTAVLIHLQLQRLGISAAPRQMYTAVLIHLQLQRLGISAAVQGQCHPLQATHTSRLNGPITMWLLVVTSTPLSLGRLMMKMSQVPISGRLPFYKMCSGTYPAAAVQGQCHPLQA